MRIVYTSLFFLVISCTSPQPQIENNYEKVDSIIQNSEIIFRKNNSINRESERIIAEKVNETVAEIKGLKEEAKTAKLAIKTVIRVDTIYIETKKNFWGKTKTNTTIKSDSTQTIDSLENK